MRNSPYNNLARFLKKAGALVNTDASGALVSYRIPETPLQEVEIVLNVRLTAIDLNPYPLMDSGDDPGGSIVLTLHTESGDEITVNPACLRFSS